VTELIAVPSIERPTAHPGIARPPRKYPSVDRVRFAVHMPNAMTMTRYSPAVNPSNGRSMEPSGNVLPLRLVPRLCFRSRDYGTGSGRHVAVCRLTKGQRRSNGSIQARIVARYGKTASKQGTIHAAPHAVRAAPDIEWSPFTAPLGTKLLCWPVVYLSREHPPLGVWPLGVAVHIEGVHAAGYVAEILVSIYLVPHDGQLTLCHGGRSGIIHVGDHEPFDALTYTVDGPAVWTSLTMRCVNAVHGGHNGHHLVRNVQILIVGIGQVHGDPPLLMCIGPVANRGLRTVLRQTKRNSGVKRRRTCVPQRLVHDIERWRRRPSVRSV